MRASISTLTTKGQVTIPNTVRHKMNLHTGSKVEFIACDGYIMLVPIDKSVSKLQGILPKPSQALSINEMDTIIKDSHDRN